MPTLSIIVVNYNTRELLLQCLRSLRTAPQSFSVEIIVVDNASTDGSVRMCRELFPEVNVIENSENVGFGQANNQAIHLSQSEFVLLLNSDTVVFPDTVEKMIGAIRRNDRIGVLGCRIVNPKGGYQPSCLRFPSFGVVVVERLLLHRISSKLPRTVIPTSDVSSSVECDWVDGACMLIRRAALEDGGLFDSGIWLYGEELDLCYRIKKSGWSIVFDPETTVVHFGGASWDQESYSPTVLGIAGLLRFCKAHFSRKAYYASCGVTAVGAVLRALIYAALAIVSRDRRRWHIRELRSNILLFSRISTGAVLEVARPCRPATQR